MPESVSDITAAVSAELDRWFHGRRRKHRRIAAWTASAVLTVLVAVFAWRIKRVPANFRTPID